MSSRAKKKAISNGREDQKIQAINHELEASTKLKDYLSEVATQLKDFLDTLRAAGGNS